MSEPTVAHRSYSQFTDWMRCGHHYYLTRRLQVPAVPGWWLVGGKAAHAAIEQIQRHILETEGR